MDILSNLKYAEGSRKKVKRIGRGEGSGHGGTATKGMNGQMSRSGAKKKAWFEGGQMPLQRRVPKFGFTNKFREEYQIVNLSSLNKLAEKEKDKVVNSELLKAHGLIAKSDRKVKILADGEIKLKVNVEVSAFSKSAKEKIEAAGGSIKKV
jgi:large subunit ribosomal protein L15